VGRISRTARIISACGATLIAALGGAAVGGAADARAAANFHIRGGGDGHGIGMSQYGAYGYALHGRDYRWILAHYYQGTSIGRLDAEPVVRALIADGGPVSFSGASVVGGKHVDAGASYSVRSFAGGLLSLVDLRGKEVARYTGAPLVVTGPGPLSVTGVGLYRGSLELRPAGAGAGGVEVVDALGLEDYVRGVISAEMPASWSAEALRAQAVAARTYAITTDAGGTAFDQYSDTRSQMYRGVAAETPSTDAAVAATAGQVVTYRGEPAVTYFFNSSGGHTENIENVWPGAAPEPWLRGVSDPYDNAGGDPFHAWGQDMTASAAAARLGGLVKGTFIGERVVRHGSSARVLSAQVVGSGGTVTVTGQVLQKRFGLLTTLATFTTISSRVAAGSVAGSGAGAAGTGGVSAPGGSPSTGGTSAMTALVPLVHQLVASLPTVSGRVFPGAAGAGISLQQRVGSAWRTVATGRLAPDGTYLLTPPAAGTYRVLYRGLYGPVVPVS
jgi:stage II sporulation protein D